MIADIVSVIDANLAIASAVAVVAGFIHGFAGFGVGLVLVPSLAILLGPVEAVAIAGIASIAATAQLIPGAVRVMDRRLIWPILVPTPFAVVAGTQLLVVIDPLIMQRSMGALVFALGLVLLFGFRWRARRSIGAGVSVGLLGGFLGGSTSMGGPIFTTYILSSEVGARSMRGGILVVTTTVSVFTVAALAVSHAIELETVTRSAVIFLPNALGIWAGAKLFGKSADATYRRVALALLLIIGLAAMIA